MRIRRMTAPPSPCTWLAYMSSEDARMRKSGSHRGWAGNDTTSATRPGTRASANSPTADCSTSRGGLFPPPHSSTTASGPATSTSYDPVPGLGLSRSEGRAHREPEHIRLLTPSLGPVGRTRKLWRNEAADTACVTRGSCGEHRGGGGVRERSFRDRGRQLPGSVATAETAGIGGIKATRPDVRTSDRACRRCPLGTSSTPKAGGTVTPGISSPRRPQAVASQVPSAAIATADT